MAHYGSVFHAANYSFATIGMHHVLGEIPVPPVHNSNAINASQRRLSRPNTAEETRTRNKRRKKRLHQEKKAEKRSKKAQLLTKLKLHLKYQEIEFGAKIDKLESRSKSANDRVAYYKDKWMQDKRISMHHINRENLIDLHDHEIVGEGTFGCCKKKFYRGHHVVVKYFKGHSSSTAVKNEAEMINSFDHPGLPFVFGLNTESKPFLMVTEFYGINGNCVTLGKAIRSKKIFSTVAEWAEILRRCSEAISHIHRKNYIHCDLKCDNIVITTVADKYCPVVIYFGKMREANNLKKYKLTVQEQENYRKHHWHIAREVVRGTHPYSKASDVISFGQIISLVCHFNPSKELEQVAKKCIHGTPGKRPMIEEVTTDLQSIAQCTV